MVALGRRISAPSSSYKKTTKTDRLLPIALPPVITPVFTLSPLAPLLYPTPLKKKNNGSDGQRDAARPGHYNDEQESVADAGERRPLQLWPSSSSLEPQHRPQGQRQSTTQGEFGKPVDVNKY